MTRLRLFPLQTVLFPAMDLSLQVFEPRYLTLVEECLDQREPFGVVLIRRGREVGGGASTHRVGTTARIKRAWPTRDGRLMIEAVGERRFRVTEPLADQPYPCAEVEFPVDEASDVDAQVVSETRERLEQVQRLRDTISGEYHREVALPESPSSLADAAGAAGRGMVPNRTLQRLLATLSVRRRVEQSSELMAAVLAGTHEQAQAVIAQRWNRVERRN